jgi:hypothetical protein
LLGILTLSDLHYDVW